MKRIAIVGGGISGLTAAFRLEKYRSEGIDYVLFESGANFGGVIRTERYSDCLIEAGPDSFLSEKPWAADLCRDLGLGGELIGSNDRARKTWILLHGRLVPLPEGLMFMVPTDFRATLFSPLFSWSTRVRILREWFFRAQDHEDESVADFVRRHYGYEMVERVADPLLAGVYGGAAGELSVQSVLPRFAEIEARQGSLGRALIASRKLHQADPSRPMFTSLKGGMQQLIEALVARVPETSRRNSTRVAEVKPESGRWLIITGERRTEEFDAVIVATPACCAVEFLQSASPDLAAELSAIPYSSSVTITLAFDSRTRATLPAGFGILAPRSERRRILAATFVHNKFPQRAPDNIAMVRCFLGGSQDQQAVDLPERELQQIALDEFSQMLGIPAAPLFTRIHKWKKAMALYTVGHKARLERIRGLNAGLPGLALAGNAYSGIGVPDCVRSGTEAARRVLGDLGIRLSSSVSAG